MRSVCGVHQPYFETNDPCGQSASLCDGEDYPCGKPPSGKSLLTSRQGRTGTEERILHPVCGVTLPHPMTCDPRGLTAMEAPFHPYHPPQPFTAAILDHGHVSAMLLVSVKGVISTPLQSLAPKTDFLTGDSTVWDWLF